MSDLPLTSDLPEPSVLNVEDAPDDLEPQLLPLDGWHRARGGRMVAFAGYMMPVQYEGIMAEHLWTRESAGLFDVSHMGQLTVSGEGAEAALERMLPAAIEPGLPMNQARYSLLLTDGGGILDDLMLTRLAPGEVYVVVNGATKYDDVAHMLDYLPDDVTLNLMEDHALLALQGPNAVDALARLVPGVEALTFMHGASFAWHPESPSPSGEGLGSGSSAEAGDFPTPSPSPEGEGSAIPLWISRSGYTGEDGFEISVPADAAQALADALCGEPEVKPIGLGARDSLRLEAGLPLYGHDLDPETTPVMADLGFALSKRRRDAADFPGAERIMAERAAGPVSKRVGLLVEGRQPVREGAAVVDADGSTVGRVTSGGFAPTVGQPIAMAYVPLAMAAPGTRVTLAQRGKIHHATVAAMPFVPHRYVRGAK